MAREDVKILGIEQLVKNLLQFQKEFKGNVMAKALRKGANVIRDQANANVTVDPKDDGIHLKDDIKVRRDPRPQTQGMNEIMYVRPYGKSARYYHIQEFGWISGGELKKGQRFMTRAWESKKVEALDKIIFELKKDVTKQVARLKT